MKPEIKKMMIEAAKNYSSNGNYGVTTNNPEVYKHFRAEQDSAVEILTPVNEGQPVQVEGFTPGE